MDKDNAFDVLDLPLPYVVDAGLPPLPSGDKYLVGIQAIAREVDPKISPRRVQRMLIDGVIPARKVGQTWITTAYTAKAAYHGKKVAA